MQTNIFKQIAINNIEKLLEQLNDGLKEKDKYIIIACESHNDYYILEVINKYNDRLFNIVDHQGLTPKNFIVNWRNFAHIINELKQ